MEVVSSLMGVRGGPVTARAEPRPVGADLFVSPSLLDGLSVCPFGRLSGFKGKKNCF